MLMCILVLVLSLVAPAVATLPVSDHQQQYGEVCDGTMCPESVSLLQLHFEAPGNSLLAKRNHGPGLDDDTNGPHRAGRALEYFMKWNHGSVEGKVQRELVRQQHVVTDPALLQQDSEQSAVRAASLIAAAEQARCGNTSLRRSWSLLEKTESRGVEHMVLRSEGTAAPKIQYLAVQHEKILVADPPVACMIQKSGTIDTNSTHRDGGGRELLDPKTDELVKDCKKLLVRTAADICNKTMEVKVLTAIRQVIDGFLVNMEVELTGPLGKTTHHYPSCLFEKSLNHTDASLLQQEADPADADPTEAEKSGLVATLQMHTELCKADEEDGNSTKANSIQPVAFGELSLYKGFEHVNDELGRIEVPLREGTPSDVDHRNMFPECFPLKDGMEVVRNQGQCGSCWAFASASAAMNNLCASNHGIDSLASTNDRFEVSVQQIISCNSQEEGCDGGYAAAANDAILKTHGLSKERDYPYQCGSGDPHNHFDQSSGTCDSFPWGATCAASNSAVPGWMWSGVSVVSGEDSMKSLIADGNSLYVSMKVYGNFMSWTTGVYTTPSEGEKGGHALVAMGYGTEGTTPYWLLQNSWGPGGWGVEGFGKVLRGSNLLEIETDAYWIKAWVSGGKEPECTDGPTTDFTSGGQDIPCADAKGSLYGDMCSTHSKVRANCPKTCDSCLVVGAPASAPGNGSPGANNPTPSPTTSSTTSTPAPASLDHCLKDATSMFGNMYPCVVENTCSQAVQLKCKSETCTQDVQPGYVTLTCNGQTQTEVCTDPGECQMSPV
jgi:C1A family cysteine protease